MVEGGLIFVGSPESILYAQTEEDLRGDVVPRWTGANAVESRPTLLVVAAGLEGPTLLGIVGADSSELPADVFRVWSGSMVLESGLLAFATGGQSSLTIAAPRRAEVSVYVDDAAEPSKVIVQLVERP